MGKVIMGTTAETDLASRMALPNSKPNEDPQKDIKKKTK